MTEQRQGCCMTLLTIFISPLGLLCKGKIPDRDIVINLILYVITGGLVATIHAFYLLGLTIACSIFCFVIPPIGVYLGTKSCCKVFICFFLTLCFWIPGIIYAYHSSMSNKGDDDLNVNLAPENQA